MGRLVFCVRFQSNECKFQITRSTQGIHDLHQIPVGHRLIGTKEYTLCLVPQSRRVKSRSEVVTRHRLVAEGEC